MSGGTHQQLRARQVSPSDIQRVVFSGWKFPKLHSELVRSSRRYPRAVNATRSCHRRFSSHLRLDSCCNAHAAPSRSSQSCFGPRRGSCRPKVSSPLLRSLGASRLNDQGWLVQAKRLTRKIDGQEAPCGTTKNCCDKTARVKFFDG